MIQKPTKQVFVLALLYFSFSIVGCGDLASANRSLRHVCHLDRCVTLLHLHGPGTTYVYLIDGYTESLDLPKSGYAHLDEQVALRFGGDSIHVYSMGKLLDLDPESPFVYHPIDLVQYRQIRGDTSEYYQYRFYHERRRASPRSD
jgi:hypothetical protein